MIAGLVASVDQGEHQQREFLAMMSSTDGTIDNWPRSLREYSMAFKAGNKQDPDSPTFMEAMNGEHGEQYREAMGSEMTSLKKATTWNLMPRSQVPKSANILPLTGCTSSRGIQMEDQGSSKQDFVSEGTSK